MATPDHTVSIRNAEQVLAASVGANASLQTEPSVDAGGSRSVTRQVLRDEASGKTTAEFWTIHGAPHAWSGGRPAGSFTDRAGPDATAQLLRFFYAAHARRELTDRLGRIGLSPIRLHGSSTLRARASR